MYYQLLSTVCCLIGLIGGVKSANIGQNCDEANQEEIKTLNGWVVCFRGQYVQSACASRNGTRIALGRTVAENGLVYECSPTSANGTELTLRPVACLADGGRRTVDEGERWRSPPYWYECAANGAGRLTVRPVACADDTQVPVQEGASFVSSNFSYFCSRSDATGLLYLRPKGCLRNGAELPVGETVVAEPFVYGCQLTANSSRLSFGIVGCVSENRTYDDGETFYSSSGKNGDSAFILKCKRSGNSWAIDPVGCVQLAKTPIEHPVGQRWNETGNDTRFPRLEYEYQCQAEGDYLHKRSVRCVYRQLLASAILEPGCMRKIGGVLVMCSQITSKTDQNVVGETIKGPNKQDEQEAMNNGFRQC